MTSDFSQKLDTGWDFHQGDLGGVWESCRPAKKGTPEDALRWEVVSLPHCFNSYDGVDPETPCYRGAGWYRKDILPEIPFPGGRTLLRFEGAGQISDVWIGMVHVARHVGGYDEWSVDITDHLAGAPGNPVRISVRCTNERNLETIPSDLSDFNIYGGLYRPVRLVYEPAVHITSLRITSRVSDDLERAELTFRAELNRPGPIEAILEITGPSGTILVTAPMTAGEGVLTHSESLEQPLLWSPDSPALYRCRLTLPGDDGTPEVVYHESFGCRHFRFQKNGPFHLNGERLLLKGTHRHEDHAGLAAAMPEELTEREMRMIREMGANFIRLGHYQQSRQVLELCDELGILVWEEIPWCRGGLGGDVYRQMGRDMLGAMIRQHFNHPSVILWGLGNENDWPGDFPEFDEAAIRSFMRELHEMARELDPDRRTALRRCEFCRDIPDVYSPSIWAGWYRGHYREYRESTLQHIREVDHFLHVEWGASSHADRFSEDPYLGLENLRTGVGTDERGDEASLYGGFSRVSKDGNWSENYACDLFDWTLKEQETMPELTGTAFWPFKDFATPLRPENPVPYVNQKGVVERDLTPKEVYYVVRSYWSEEPMLRIFGHRWTDRWGTEGESKEFRVYSNCREVELFLDGESLGIRTRNPQDFPAAGLRWEARLSFGSHHLRAVASGQSIEDSLRFTYHREDWGVPDSLRGFAIRRHDGTIDVEVEAVDASGRLCLDCEKTIVFSLAGEGTLLDNLGTSRGSRKVQFTNGKAGIRVRAEAGAAVVGATCIGLEPLFLTV